MAGLLSLWVALGTAASGATLEVGPGQTYATVGAAVLASASGDLVRIHPGTYAEAVQVTSTTLTFEGVGGAAATVLRSTGGNQGFFRINTGAIVEVRDVTLDGGGTDRAAEVRNDGVLVLTNAVVRDGDASDGGCVYVHNDAQLEVVESSFTGCTASTDGGAIRARNASRLSVSGGQFVGNVAGRGGAIACDGIACKVFDAEFVGNSADLGGALALVDATAEVVACSFFENTALVAGGGIYGSVPIDVRGSVFCENTAVLDGGGIAADAAAVAVNNHFVGNVAGTDGGAMSSFGTAWFGNGLVAFNTSASAAVYGPGTLQLDYSLFYGNAPSDYLVSIVGPGNLVGVDPLLMSYVPGDCAGSNLRPNPGSPAIDAGDPDPAYDDVDGSRSDIGAFGGPTPFGHDADGDGFDETVDCDDSDATIYPGAPEVVGDGVDQDCDGFESCYVDGDSDGFGTVLAPATTGDCSGPSEAAVDGDCDDAVAAINPAAAEVCDALDTDEDCDGLADDADPSATGTSSFYGDGDGDGFGDAGVVLPACDAAPGRVADATDCDDTDPAMSPAATEVCDALDVDEDCDGLADDADASATGQASFYDDADADGYGDAATGVAACDAGQGQVVDATDCDDSDAAVSPGAQEVCDALDVDEDCDGLSDDGDPTATGQGTTWADGDGDGYGDAAAPLVACDPGAGQVGDDTDCDDSDAAVNPGAQEVCDALDVDEDCDGLSDDGDPTATGQGTTWADTDGDGYGDAAAPLVSCDPGPGQVGDATDCDDGVAAVHPGAQEVCDALDVDEDCDGLSDDADASATGQVTTWLDGDGDGYGDAAASTVSCDPGADQVSDATDCNDANAAVNPGAQEVCDPYDVDEDCDGLSDDADASATGQTTTWADTDGDGYGDASSALVACDPGPGQVADDSDCDDENASIHPAATEVCDAADVDEDCDGLADDLDPDATSQASWYPDADGDGFGAAGTAATLACEAPTDHVGDATDCDDSDATVSPAAVEVCDPYDVDEDCNGLSDDADPGAQGQLGYFADADGDGFGDAAAPIAACDPEPGEVSDATDCDDQRADVSPAGTEVCDDLDADEDCDGLSDDADPGAAGKVLAYPDLDGDGFGDVSAGARSTCDPLPTESLDASDCNDASSDVYPGALEVSGDGIDQDCTGSDLEVRYGSGGGCGCAGEPGPGSAWAVVGLLGVLGRRRATGG